MTLMNDTKFEKELTCSLKIDLRKLMKFELSTQKFKKIYTLMGSFYPK